MRNACFCSGPCAKRPGWKFPDTSFLGRSHRSEEGLKLIQSVLKLQREILRIPENYLVAVTPSSTSGAMEMLLWNLIGDNGTDILNCCIFSNHWAHDIIDELQAKNTNLISASFPNQSDVSSVNFENDVVFCISSTTSGTAFRDLNWIPDDRKGLTICDASSGAFAMDIDWKKLDATAFSWQKGLGGEAGLGVIIVSPRAVQRIIEKRQHRAIPRIFRMATDGKLNSALFDGCTINTPSMLCMSECYDNLMWAKENGGLQYLIDRVEKNYNTVQQWIASQNAFRFIVDEKCRAHHIACFDINDEKYQDLSKSEKVEFLHRILRKAEELKYGYDFLGHAHEEPHIRIWCGPTIESDDLQFFLPKLLEVFHEVRASYDLR